MQSQNRLLGRLRRHGYLIAGYILFGLGAIGAVLPVMPTAVFWIAAAACFARSSERMYQRIVNAPHFGPVIEDYLSQGAISTKSKAAAVSGMGIGLAIAAFTLGVGLPFAVTFAMLGLASAYVLTRPQPVRVPAQGR